MPSLIEVYKESLKLLANPDSEEIIVRALLCANNSLSKMSDFYLYKDQNIKDLQRFHNDLSRYLSGEPLAYITNEASFLSHSFYVDKRVLIPRNETEEVVLYAQNKISAFFKNKDINIFDVCCGSGCIGISLKTLIPSANIFMSDISKDAIEVSKINVERSCADVTLLSGDSLTPFIDTSLKCDVIVSNPPYILKHEYVEPSVSKYEPYEALFTTSQLDVYRSILKNALRVKRSNSLLIVFEIGPAIEPLLRELVFSLYPDSIYETRKDINGYVRMCSILISK